MKRFNKFVMLFCFLLLVTGCVKHNMHMTISKNGKIELSSVIAYASSSGESVTEEEKAKYKSNGFKVEDYTENDYKGVKLTKEYKISEVSSNSAVTLVLNDLYETEKPIIFQKVGRNKYKANFTLDTRTPDGQTSTGVDISYSVTLPNEPTSHNADKVNENTLTWNANLGEVKTIQYEFATNGSFPLWIILGIVGVVAIVLVIVVNNRKKRKANEMTGMEELQLINPNVGQNPPVENSDLINSVDDNMVSTPIVEEPIMMPEREVPVPSSNEREESQSTDI